MITGRRLMQSVLPALLGAILTFALFNNLLTAVLVFMVIFVVSLTLMSSREKANQPKSPVSLKDETYNEEPVEKTAPTSEKLEEPAIQVEQQVESTTHTPAIPNEPAIQVEQQIEVIDKDAELVGCQVGELSQGTIQVRQQAEMNKGKVVGMIIGNVGADNQKK